jgi:hypothetical protein
MKLFPQRHIHPIETVPFNGTKRLPRMATTCRGLKFATNPDSPALMLPPLQHVAAVVALMLQFNGGNRSLTPAQICSTLTNAAIDVDDPTTVGFDVGLKDISVIDSVHCNGILVSVLNSLFFVLPCSGLSIIRAAACGNTRPVGTSFSIATSRMFIGNTDP